MAGRLRWRQKLQINHTRFKFVASPSCYRSTATFARHDKHVRLTSQAPNASPIRTVRQRVLKDVLTAQTAKWGIANLNGE